MYIQYWDHDASIDIELTKELSISIKNGKIEIEIEVMYGATNVYNEVLLYDLCGLIALYEEVYGK